MDSKELCLICGKPKSAHHEFIPAPAECVCDKKEWLGAHYIPGICMEFVSDPSYPDICDHCEHDKECHGDM